MNTSVSAVIKTHKGHKSTKKKPALATSKLLLVPYSVHHVPIYHAWMQDPDLQAATASEPLSMDEEYAMQRSWRSDCDKLTFIICLPLAIVDSVKNLTPGVNDGPARMVGDINLFLFNDDGDGGDDKPAGSGPGAVVGEIELMIARKELQRQGYGRAALLSFMHYILLVGREAIIAEYCGLQPGRSLSYLRVKINQSNKRSIALFQSVGFVQTEEGANYFGEVELRFQVSDATIERLQTVKKFETAVLLPYRHVKTI